MKPWRVGSWVAYEGREYEVLEEFPRSKRRSRLYELAAEAVSKIRDLGILQESDFQDIIRHFDTWLYHYGKGKVGVLSNGNRFAFVRQICRFQKAYKHTVWNRIKHLAKVSFKHHIVLEINPHTFLRFIDEYKWVCIAWAKLRAWLYKKYGHFEFIRVLEPHKKGRPHLHILISGIPFIDYHELEKEWKERLKCGFVYRETVRKGFSGLLYILKYVCKTVKDDSKKKFSILMAAILFATNKRLFSISRGLMEGCRKAAKLDSSGFTWLGSRPQELMDEFVRDKGLKFGKVLVCDVKTEDLYSYSELLFVDDTG